MILISVGVIAFLLNAITSNINKYLINYINKVMFKRIKNSINNFFSRKKAKKVQEAEIMLDENKEVTIQKQAKLKIGVRLVRLTGKLFRLFEENKLICICVVVTAGLVLFLGTTTYAVEPLKNEGGAAMPDKQTRRFVLKLRKVMSVLAEQGYVRAARAPRGQGRGNQPRIFLIHPKALPLFVKYVVDAPKFPAPIRGILPKFLPEIMVATIVIGGVIYLVHDTHKNPY